MTCDPVESTDGLVREDGVFIDGRPVVFGNPIYEGPKGDWPQANYDMLSTRYSSDFISITSSPTKEWDFFSDYDLASPPVISDGVMFIPTGGGLYAVNLLDGTEKWFYETPDTSIWGTPAVTSEMVVFGTPEGGLYALNKDDSTVEWSKSYSTSITSKIGYDGTTIYAAHGQLGPDGSALEAITAADGTSKWTFSLTYRSLAKPTIHNGTLYTVDQTDYTEPDPALIYAIDPTDGTEIWRSSIYTGRYPQGGVSISSNLNMGYVGSWDRSNQSDSNGAIQAIDLSDGSNVWVEDRSRQVHGPPAVHDGTVYACMGYWRGNDTSESTQFAALDAADGTVQWRWNNPNNGNEPDEAPVVADGVLYVGWNGGFHALDPSDGTTLWEADDPGGGTTVYALANQDWVFGVDHYGQVSAYSKPQ